MQFAAVFPEFFIYLFLFSVVLLNLHLHIYLSMSELEMMPELEMSAVTAKISREY